MSEKGLRGGSNLVVIFRGFGEIAKPYNTHELWTDQQSNPLRPSDRSMHVMAYKHRRA
jgi:hypothetical protein